MQVFVPYREPIKVAECLSGDKRLRKQIIECQQILDAINGVGKGWFNHPVVTMYKEHTKWLEHYASCLALYANDAPIHAKVCSDLADLCTPSFLTDELCNQHKRRLFTKNPQHYAQFAEYGTSDYNLYYVDGSWRKYVNGKRIE